MVRIVVTTFGSTGDLNPFIAHGLALRSNGHDVLFAVEANSQQQLDLLGFHVNITRRAEQALKVLLSTSIYRKCKTLLSF